MEIAAGVGSAAAPPLQRHGRRERPPRAQRRVDEEVWAAISDAGLKETVERLPDGIDTVLGDRGAGLSAGERQRVALARAFLRDAPLLLLDEPTANLDANTEHDVVQAIRRLAEGRTVVLVAHRPALMALADRVLPVATAEVAA